MDRKVSPKYYDGVKFILLSDLPFDQCQQFSEWVRTDSFIVNSFSEERLIRYEIYDDWYNLYYATEKDFDRYL